jgi:type IV pilus assembly protein PilA
MRVFKSGKGFTLLELIVVVAIIAILSLIAMPSLDSKLSRSQIIESVELIKSYKERVSLFYSVSKNFPHSNVDVEIPKAEFLIGNYVQRIDLEDGAFHFTFGHKAIGKLKNKVLSIRPMVVVGSPESPISWVCGHSKIPEGMSALGKNKTDISSNLLPFNCM